VLSGTGALIKTNTATLTLTNANTMSGGTTIGQGAISIGNGGTSGSLAGAITNNGSLIFNRSDALTHSGIISGTGTVTNSGAGALTLSGVNTFSGGFTLSAGSLVIGNNQALGTGLAVFANNTAVDSDSSARVVANDIQFQNLSIGGTGALTLSGTLTHTRAGGSTITNNNPGGLTLGNINLSSSSTTRTVTFAGSGNTTVNGVIANGTNGATSGNIELNASGATLTLSGANTYDGTTTVTAGTLIAANSSALGSTTNNTTVASGATLAFSNNISENEAVEISGTGVGGLGALRNISGNNTNTGTVTLGAASKIGVDAGSSLTLSNIDTVFGTRPLTITANGSLTVLGSLLSSTAITNVLQKDGTGSMIVSNNGTTGGMQLQLGNGTFTLAAGSFSTNTSTVGSAASPRAIDLGISSAGDSTNNVAFYANSGVTVSNSIYVAPNTTNSSLRILGTESTSGTATFNNEIYLGGNLTVSAANGGTALFSGNIVNSGNLTKTNGGTVILSGANTFGGAVVINGGTLVVSNSAAINDTNAVTIASGATLSLGSSETVGSITGGGNITLLGNQLIAGGNNSSTEFSGIMSSTSSAAQFVKFGAGTLTLSGSNTMNGQLYLVNGTTLFTVNQGAGFTNTINLGETNGSAAATVAFGGSGLSVTNPINVRSGNNGTMTIEAQNSTGTLTLGGALTLSKNATLKATNGGDVILSGAVNLGTSQFFTDNTTGSDITISGNISANAARTGELLVDDTGTVYLTGNNSADMKVTLSQGALVVGNITNLGDPSGTFFGSKLNLNGGTLSATNDVTAGANFGVTVSANGGNLLASSGKTLKFVDFINDAGAGTAAYTLGIGGGGTVILEKASGNNQFNNAMTFSVTNGSTLSTPNLLALGNSTTNIISLNNGTFAYTGNTASMSQRFTIGASGGTVNVSNANQTLSLTNTTTFTGALTKSGSGILDINRANTGTGGANVTAGILRVGNASALGTGGTVAVSSGATLQLSNGINFARTLNLSGNGTVSGALLSVNGANTN
jgi:autotransporter-associated beta strand protein